MQLDFNYQDYDYITVSDTVKLNWSRVWSNRGHALGEGMISPNQKHFYLNIPKNSSSSTKAVLESLEWNYASLNDFPNAHIVVILRDPIERWISGAAEYLMMYHQNVIDNIVDPGTYDFLPLLGDKLGMSLLFDRMTFDDHTERQAVFLQDIPFERCTWLMNDQNFSTTFSNYLNSIGYPNTFAMQDKKNSTENSDNNKKRVLKQFLKLVIDRDEYKKYNLKQWHWCDYHIINSANFYGTR